MGSFNVTFRLALLCAVLSGSVLAKPPQKIRKDPNPDRHLTVGLAACSLSSVGIHGDSDHHGTTLNLKTTIGQSAKVIIPVSSRARIFPGTHDNKRGVYILIDNLDHAGGRTEVQFAALPETALKEEKENRAAYDKAIEDYDAVTSKILRLAKGSKVEYEKFKASLREIDAQINAENDQAKRLDLRHKRVQLKETFLEKAGNITALSEKLLDEYKNATETLKTKGLAYSEGFVITTVTKGVPRFPVKVRYGHSTDGAPQVTPLYEISPQRAKSLKPHTLEEPQYANTATASAAIEADLGNAVSTVCKNVKMDLAKSRKYNAEFDYKHHIKPCKSKATTPEEKSECDKLGHSQAWPIDTKYSELMFDLHLCKTSGSEKTMAAAKNAELECEALKPNDSDNAGQYYAPTSPNINGDHVK